MFHKTFTSFVSAKQLHNILEHSTTLAKTVHHCTHLYIIILNFTKLYTNKTQKTTKQNTTQHTKKKTNTTKHKTKHKAN